jgi:hypothetical protein
MITGNPGAVRPGPLNLPVQASHHLIQGKNHYYRPNLYAGPRILFSVEKVRVYQGTSLEKGTGGAGIMFTRNRAPP